MKPEFAADIRMVTPFVTETPNINGTMNGKLYMSKGRLRVVSVVLRHGGDSESPP
jgi:hypothetical protein